MTVRNEWMNIRIPKAMALALDEILKHDVSKALGLQSRTDIIIRLLGAWLANINREFSLFDSNLIPDTFARTHPPPIHPPSQLPALKKPTRIYDSQEELEKAIKVLSSDKSSLPPLFQSRLQNLEDKYDDFIMNVFREIEEK
jgi:hypothetical protein